MSEPNPTVDLAGPEAAAPVPADFPPPRRIGRYRIERVLGQGGFGHVYLAHDEQLRRPVAIKVSHARLVTEATCVSWPCHRCWRRRSEGGSRRSSVRRRDRSPGDHADEVWGRQ
jgi:hypothetical protein